MGFLLTLLYVCLAFLSPADLLPALAPYRVMVWLAVLAALVSLGPALARLQALLNWQTLSFAAFLGAIPFSRAANGWFGGAVYALRDFLPSAACFLLVLLNVDTIRKLRILMVCVIALAVLQNALGIHAYIQQDPSNPRLLSQRLATDATEQEFYYLSRVRSLGFLADPNDFAQYLITVLPLLGLFWKPRAPLSTVLLIVFPAAFLLVGVYLTASRGALAGLAVLILVPLMRRYGRLFAVIVTSAALLLMLALEFGGGRGISVASGIDRLNIWSDGLGMFKRSPLWGVGYRIFTDYSIKTAHNSFLLCAAELGLLGLFFWVALLTFSALQLRAVLQAARQESLLAEHARLAGLLELSLYAFLATSWFLSRTYVLTLYVLLAMGGALYWRARQDLPAPASEPHPLLVPVKKWLLASLLACFGSVALIYASVRSRGL